MIQRYEAQQVYNPSCQNFLVITLNTITGQVILHLHHVVPLIFCHFDIMFLRLNLSSSILLNWFLVVLNDLHSLMFQWNCSFEDIDKKTLLVNNGYLDIVKCCTIFSLHFVFELQCLIVLLNLASFSLYYEDLIACYDRMSNGIFPLDLHRDGAV